MDFLLIALRNVLSGSVSTALALDFNCLSVRTAYLYGSLEQRTTKLQKIASLVNVLTDLLLTKFSYVCIVFKEVL